MAFCGKCGNPIEEGIKFCPACGAAIETATPAPEPAPAPAPAPEPAPEPTSEEKLEKATKTIDSMAQKLGNTADHSTEFDKADVEANKVMALLSYFGFLVIVPLLAAKESRYARYHANQGLVLLLAMFGYIIAESIVSAILRAVLFKALNLWTVYSLCGTILDLVYVGFSILAIIGIVNVLNGRAKELPIIGKYRVLK